MASTARRRTRIGVSAAALSASFLAGTMVATGFPGATDAPRQTPLRLAHGALRPATSCEQLRQWYVDRALDQVTAWGWGSPLPVYYADGVDAGFDSAAVAPRAAEAPAASPGEAVGSSGTGTNVQEAGVDEPDTVKTQGSLLVTVDGPRLTTYDVSGDEPQLLASIVLPDVRDPEILLAGDTVVAVGTDSTPTRRIALPGGMPLDYLGMPGDTRVTTVDVGDPAAPAITDTRSFEGQALAVRLHDGAGGDLVRVVISTGLPDLPFVSARGGARSQRNALEHNREIVRDSEIDDWLPSVTVGTGLDGDPVPAVDCADVALPEDSDSVQTVSVVAFAADEPAETDTTAVVADAQTAYLSADRLYLASSPWVGGWWGVAVPEPMPQTPPDGVRGPFQRLWEDFVTPDEPGTIDPTLIDPVRPVAPPTDAGVTRLYAFALSGTDTSFVAAGEVEGQVRDRWAMDAVEGSLRLAVGPTIETGNFNSVVTLAERDGELVETGRVDALGVGEEIKSVRWFDDLAVLVTFRQTDPLYAVDLTDPARPRALGELKIPGFSEYLHPIGDDRLLAVGQSASPDGTTRGAQLGLFDLSDLTSPARLDTAGLGWSTQGLAGVDPRQFTWLPDRSTALTVVSDWRTNTGDVVVAHVAGDRLETRSVRVEAGRDVSRVRLVPLSDGRVVLWTGAEVSFLAV